MAITEANPRPIFQNKPSVQAAIITDVETTIPVTLYTSSSSEGGLIDSISVVSTDTVDQIVQLTLTDNSGTDYAIGEAIVPALSGSDGVVVAFNLLSKELVLQADGGRTVPPNGILKVNAKTTITVAASLTFVANGGDY